MFVDQLEKGSAVCDIEAEKALLGTMLLDNHAIDLVSSIADPSDMFRLAHQNLFQAIVDVHERGVGVDPITVFENLQKRKLIDQDNEELTTQYIAELFDITPTAANAEYYARIIKDRSVRRQLHQRGCEIVRNAGDISIEISEIVDEAHSKILDISSTSAVRQVSSVSDALAEALHAIDRKQTRGGGIKTGFLELDEITGGLHRQELIIIAARPSVGKTALALNIATRVAFSGRSVLFVSLEQSTEGIGYRILASEAEVDMHKLRTLKLSSEDIKAMLEAKGRISHHRLFIADVPGQTVTQIGAEGRRTKLRRGIDLMVVDYLQLIESEYSDRKQSREQQVSMMSKRLKGFAKQLDIPVIVLAQLNRESEKLGRPRLHHLRESGSLEQDADVVMLLHQPEGKESEVVIDIAKQRDGRTAEVTLEFIKRFMRFENMCSYGPPL